MNYKTLIALAAASWIGLLHAQSFKLEVDLGATPESKTVRPAVLKGTEKASERYFKLAEKTHPNLLIHAFAPLSEQAKGADREVEYAVRAAKDRKSFVLMIVNRRNEGRTAEISLKRGKPRDPVYRRVYSEDGGKSWTTIAWQPPRAPELVPWTVEIPAKTVQTVTIAVK